MLDTNVNNKFGKEGLTFDDVLLIPGESDCTPDMVDIHTHLTKDIVLNTPIMTSAMDTVTESKMAIAIAREGGIGIIHKNMTIAQQAEEVDKVKRSENGVIVNPFFLSPQDSVFDADALMGKYKISGVPVVENGKLVGILTNRDLRFITDYNQKIGEVMTKDHLVTAPVGTNLQQAQGILRKHKIEKLPLVDENGFLKGLITIKDIEKSVQYPNTARDAGGRLLCGAAIGITPDVLDRAGALLKAQADVLVLDSAHGHSKNILDAVSAIKGAFPDCQLVAGNVATYEGARAMLKAGADTVSLNGILFESKSRSRLAIERLALESLEYSFGGRCATVYLTKEQIAETGADGTDLEGITSLPRMIEGVEVGITIRQQPTGSYKVSVRTVTGVDASAICAHLGGGGHKQAAGCELLGSLDNAKAALLTEVEKALCKES